MRHPSIHRSSRRRRRFPTEFLSSDGRTSSVRTLDHEKNGVISHVIGLIMKTDDTLIGLYTLRIVRRHEGRLKCYPKCVKGRTVQSRPHHVHNPVTLRTSPICTTCSLNNTAIKNKDKVPLSIRIQGHHHNGDQAARRPHMMRSLCGRRFGCNFKGGLFD